MKILTSLCLILLFLSGCQTLDSLDRGSFGSFERLKNKGLYQITHKRCYHGYYEKEPFKQA